ncbi:MAG: hypothetical protein HY237_05700 [Acidobacteria bacterium]|nr:hypothetical protein [Acidobacteriota bacterium]
MPAPLSAVDSISPAFARGKQMLFQPFRLGVWARLAVVAVVTGELGSGGFSYSGGGLPARQGSDQWLGGLPLAAEPTWEQVRAHLPWILLGAAVLLVLFLLWIYADCVFRFILFDAVLSGRCGLREGWRRWRSRGRWYFLWVIVFLHAAMIVLVTVAGVPIYLAWRAGWFSKTDQHFGALFGWGALLFIVLLAVFVVLAVIDLLARDFLVPVMALENLNVIQAWQRLGPMLRAEKGAFAGYVLMKIVLAIGSAVLFGILNVFALLVLLIPLGLIGLAVFFIAKAAGLTWTLSTILLAVALGLLTLAGLFYVIGFVYAPGLVFFQSYALNFFGSCYAALGARVFPASEPPPPAAPSPPREPAPG